MKALSIWPAYAMEIAYGFKTKEYRSWDTHYRGDLLICSTIGHGGKGTIPGHAVCVATLVDTKKISNNMYAWILENVRAIKPVKVKGQQRIFNVDIEPECMPDDLTDDQCIDWCIENFYPHIKGVKYDKNGDIQVPAIEYL